MPVPSAAAPTAARVTAPALLRGRSHHEHAPPPTSLQRSLMLVSSLLYLCPAAAWFHFGFVKLCAAFGAVTMLSVTADSGGGILPEALMRPMRVADRTVGTLSLISSVVCNSNSILNWFLSMAAVLSALCFLTTGRASATADPCNRWRYLFLHGMWHAYGSGVLVMVTFHAQREAARPASHPEASAAGIAILTLLASIFVAHVDQNI